MEHGQIVYSCIKLKREIKIMEEFLITLGEALDLVADWIYSLTSGLATGDIEPPESMKCRNSTSHDYS